MKNGFNLEPESAKQSTAMRRMSLWFSEATTSTLAICSCHGYRGSSTFFRNNQASSNSQIFDVEHIRLLASNSSPHSAHCTHHCTTALLSCCDLPMNFNTNLRATPVTMFTVAPVMRESVIAHTGDLHENKAPRSIHHILQ